MAGNVWLDKAHDYISKEDYPQAKLLLEKAFEEGCTDAYNDLGQLYYYGHGVEQDFGHSFELFQKGVKAGNVLCLQNLGICYYRGHGVESDLQKAAYYNQKAADKGLPIAMFDTGVNYERGLGVQQDINKAVYWLEQAAANDFAEAYAELGNLYYSGTLQEKDLKKSLVYYQRGAELGENKSKMALAEFYEEGKVVEKDTEKARCLYREAFDKWHELATVYDDCDAQLSLAHLFFYGQPLLGIPVDYNQAVQWLLKATQNGNGIAENNLGIMYEFGLGVGQNYERALEWYLKAAARMNMVAISNAASCYYLGRGTERDYFKAADLYTRAANLGYANSQEVLGEMYLEGKGVEQNYVKAVKWLKKACENGERSAFGPLGDCYRKGMGTEKDLKTAFKLYQKGAEQGDVRSKVSMAQCLIEGWGIRCDCTKAFQTLDGICHNEESYRAQLMTVTTHEDENGNVFLKNPLDEEELKYYAKAYYMLALLNYSAMGTKKNAGEAIRLLHVADKLGYKNDDCPNETAESLLNKIIKESASGDIRDAVDCYVEVREVKRSAERYDVVIHHADGTETVVDFKGRNKFFYILALLVAHEGNSVCGLTTRHFSYMHDVLCKMANLIRVRTSSYEDWINEFIYLERSEAIDQREERNDKKKYRCCSLCPSKYSNAFSGANRAISACCDKEEYETFQLRTMGRKPAVTTILIASSQIVLPQSLMEYLDGLPTRNEIDKHKPQSHKWMPIEE